MLVFIIHSSAGGNLGCFHFLAIVNIAAMNMAEQTSVQCYVESFGHVLRSSVIRSYGRFIFRFFKHSPHPFP